MHTYIHTYIQSYGMAATLTPYSCREEVINLLVKVRQEASKLVEPDDEAMENNLSAALNTCVAIDAEKNYKVMVVSLRTERKFYSSMIAKIDGTHVQTHTQETRDLNKKQ